MSKYNKTLVFKDVVSTRLEQSLDAIKEVEDLIKHYRRRYEYALELCDDLRPEEFKMAGKRASTKEDFTKIYNIVDAFETDFTTLKDKLEIANINAKEIVTKEYNIVTRPEKSTKLKEGQKEIYQAKEGFTICEVEAIKLIDE